MVWYSVRGWGRERTEIGRVGLVSYFEGREFNWEKGVLTV